MTSLVDFLNVFDKVKVRRDQAIKWFKDNERERASKESALKNKQWYVKRYPDKPQYAQEAQELEDKIKQVDEGVKRVKDLPEEEQLARLSTTQAITLKDVLRGKAELYQETLSQKNHQELLEEVVGKFLKEPERYPLWLQYMVIHFSGMRYKSAHGSWADPRDLLQSLKMSSVTKGVKRSSDETIATDALEKVAEYQQKMIEAEDQTRRDKIEYYLNGLKSPVPYRKRKALLDLRIDEENELVDEKMTDEQVLEELEDMHMNDQLPTWMWKEIVARTDLRLKHATDESWEDLSRDEIEERRSFEQGAYREIMYNWKKKNLTGWRREHDRANRLIVTRAVCNEVSEHIQHLRGHTPPGGLTAKPEWFLRKERDPKLMKGVRKPYFLKPDHQDDFKVGSTILWLRWVSRQPNAWRIAHPITLKNGEGLLPGGTIKRVRGKPKKAISNAKARATKQSTDWHFESSGGGFQRNRTVYTEQEVSKTSANKAGKKRKARNQNKKQVQRKKPKMVRQNQKQYLRWMHEATVAEVAETADGPVVLTFETALPYEDKRRSTIGVFKHTVGELKYSVSGRRFNGTFIGYVPEDEVEIPYSDLEHMLDWNKILRKDVVTEAEMKEYWAKAKQGIYDPAPGDVGGQEVRRQPGIVLDSPVEVTPPLTTVQHKEFIRCYQVDPVRKKAVVYQPKVELKRGVQLRVAKSQAVQIGKRTYYPITLCVAESRAESHYIRGDHMIDIPEGQLSRPVEAKGKINPRKITRANLSGKPIMYLAGVKLLDKTPFRISTVHKVTSADSGDGVIDADGTVDYYLIVDCPTKGSAKGLFIQTHAVNPITEEEYTSRRDQLQKAADLPPELLVEVAPKAGGEFATLFKADKAGAGNGRDGRARRRRKRSGPKIVKSVEDTLPKGEKLTVSSTSTVSDEKEYYRILKYDKKPEEYVGLYILVKEVNRIAEATSDGEAASTTSSPKATPAPRPKRQEREPEQL